MVPLVNERFVHGFPIYDDAVAGRAVLDVGVACAVDAHLAVRPAAGVGEIEVLLGVSHSCDNIDEISIHTNVGVQQFVVHLKRTKNEIRRDEASIVDGQFREGQLQFQVAFAPRKHLLRDQAHVLLYGCHFLRRQGDVQANAVRVDGVFRVVYPPGGDACHWRGRVKVLPVALAVSAFLAEANIAAGEIVARQAGAHRVQDEDLKFGFGGVVGE